MGATSVTGIGPGSAFPGQKGPGNERNIYVPLAGPHVVAAGTGALVGGTLTVTFPTALEGGNGDFAVVATSETTNTVYVSAKTDDANGDFASFQITGTGTDSFQWVVAKAGFGS